MEKELGRIESTSLGYDHNVISAWLHFDFGGGGQGFGGYRMDAWDKKSQKCIGSVFGMEFIMRILDAVGVEHWEDLPGKICWVYRHESQGKIIGIEAPDFVKHKKFMIQEFLDEINSRYELNPRGLESKVKANG